jgi:hypothetical protein
VVIRGNSCQKKKKYYAILYKVAVQVHPSPGRNLAQARSNWSQTDALGQTTVKIVCKCFKMNDMQQIQCSGQSNPVKVNQTDCKALMKVDPTWQLAKLRTGHRLDALACGHEN